MQHQSQSNNFTLAFNLEQSPAAICANNRPPTVVSKLLRAKVISNYDIANRRDELHRHSTHKHTTVDQGRRGGNFNLNSNTHSRKSLMTKSGNPHSRHSATSPLFSQVTYNAVLVINSTNTYPSGTNATEISSLAYSMVQAWLR